MIPSERQCSYVTESRRGCRLSYSNYWRIPVLKAIKKPRRRREGETFLSPLPRGPFLQTQIIFVALVVGQKGALWSHERSRCDDISSSTISYIFSSHQLHMSTYQHSSTLLFVCIY
ncbi:unnamed protein product [Leuciscus chuanchicus]